MIISSQFTRNTQRKKNSSSASLIHYGDIFNLKVTFLILKTFCQQTLEFFNKVCLIADIKNSTENWNLKPQNMPTVWWLVCTGSEKGGFAAATTTPDIDSEKRASRQH